MIQESHFSVHTQKLKGGTKHIYFYTSVHGNIICNSRKMETTQVTIHG